MNYYYQKDFAILADINFSLHISDKVYTNTKHYLIDFMAQVLSLCIIRIQFTTKIYCCVTSGTQLLILRQTRRNKGFIKQHHRYEINTGLSVFFQLDVRRCDVVNGHFPR